MDKSDIEKIKKIVNLTHITTGQAYELETLVRKYVDSGASFCKNCPAQIKVAHFKLVEWWKVKEIELRRNDNIDDII